MHLLMHALPRPQEKLNPQCKTWILSEAWAPDKEWALQAGSPEIDVASDFLMQQGQKMVSLAKQMRPDLLVQVEPHASIRVIAMIQVGPCSLQRCVSGL